MFNLSTHYLDVKALLDANACILGANLKLRQITALFVIPLSQYGARCHYQGTPLGNSQFRTSITPQILLERPHGRLAMSLLRVPLGR